MEGFVLKTLKKSKISYQKHVQNDHRAIEQMKILVQLYDLSLFYNKKGIVDCAPSEQNTYFTNATNVNWNFEVFKMKKAILNQKAYKLKKNISPTLTKFANQIFLLAMIYSRKDIVEYFLDQSMINVNQSIFGLPCWPSYFLLACTCSKEIVELFKNYRIKYSIGWNSLTPHIISSYKKITLAKVSYLDFITYRQYQLLLRYVDVEIVDSVQDIPIFPLDFACLIKNRSNIKTILEEIPEVGMLSRLSFVVQKEENFYLILSKYGFRTDQNFNGQTPLHISCAVDDFCSLAILCALGFDITKNSQGKWPHELGSLKSRERSAVFFNICTQTVDSAPKRVFNYDNFYVKLFDWFEILKFQPKDYEKYNGLFRYIEFNKNNRVLTYNRFSIVSVLTMSKTPVTIEGLVNKLSKITYSDRQYGDEEAIETYKLIFKYK